MGILLKLSIPPLDAAGGGGLVICGSSLGVALSIAISCPLSQCLTATIFSTESGDAYVTNPMPRYPCFVWSLGM